MEFYLELSNGSKTFRLQKDKSWRDVKSAELLPTDFLSSDAKEIIQLQKSNIVINIEGENWQIKPEDGNFGEDNILYYDVFVVRKNFSKLPSKEQLIALIEQGNDKINNSLIVNIEGVFELRDFYTLNISIDDPTIAGRNETFSAGNDYVGRAAASDNKYIDELYLNCLSMWVDHLESGCTNLYQGDSRPQSIDDLLNKIKSIETKNFSK